MTPPKRRRAGAAAEEAAPIRRLEGQHLTLGRKRGLDLAQRRRRARGQHQLLGLVVADAAESP